MTLLLARQPGESLPREGAVRDPGGADSPERFPTHQRNHRLGLWSWGSSPHVPLGHQGRQRPQEGWCAAALALAGVGADALGSLVGAPGAVEGR